MLRESCRLPVGGTAVCQPAVQGMHGRLCQVSARWEGYAFEDENEENCSCLL